MPSSISKIIRDLSNIEIDTIVSELNGAPEEAWVTHASKRHLHRTHLREGRSIHLHFIDQNSMTCVLVDDVSYHSFFPKTIEMLKELAGPNLLGRCYFHRLTPGQQILRHNDSWVTQAMPIKHRMQMYLDIPDNSILILDGKSQDIGAYKYKLIDFALNLDHYYKNNGSNPWIFLVFDILEDYAKINNIDQDHIYANKSIP